MVAIKSFPKHHYFVVCSGVMEEYARWNSDGTFSGSAGISCHAISRRFNTLEEAKEAKAAFEEYAKKYC